MNGSEVTLSLQSFQERERAIQVVVGPRPGIVCLKRLSVYGIPLVGRLGGRSVLCV
jgi:hypothetical protein